MYGQGEGKGMEKVRMSGSSKNKEMCTYVRTYYCNDEGTYLPG